MSGSRTPNLPTVTYAHLSFLRFPKNSLALDRPGSGATPTCPLEQRLNISTLQTLSVLETFSIQHPASNQPPRALCRNFVSRPCPHKPNPSGVFTLPLGLALNFCLTDLYAQLRPRDPRRPSAPPSPHPPYISQLALLRASQSIRQRAKSSPELPHLALSGCTPPSLNSGVRRSPHFLRRRSFRVQRNVRMEYGHRKSCRCPFERFQRNSPSRVQMPPIRGRARKSRAENRCSSTCSIPKGCERPTSPLALPLEPLLHMVFFFSKKKKNPFAPQIGHVTRLPTMSRTRKRTGRCRARAAHRGRICEHRQARP